MQDQSGRQQGRRNGTETVSTGVSLTFVRQSNGRMVAMWDRRDVLMDTISMYRIQPGVPVECDIQLVVTGDTERLTAVPTEATKRALQSANLWPVGDVMLEVTFRMTREDDGVYAIEPTTGKRVYPDGGFRVWVNKPSRYLCYERGRIIIARPLEEPQRMSRNEDKPSEPHTYREPSREPARSNRTERQGQGGDRRPNRRGGKGRHDDRRGQQGQPTAQAAKPAVPETKPAPEPATPAKPKPEGRKTFEERHGDAAVTEPTKPPEVISRRPQKATPPTAPLTIAEQMRNQGLVK